jgi:hypothetical protein
MHIYIYIIYLYIYMSPYASPYNTIPHQYNAPKLLSFFRQMAEWRNGLPGRSESLAGKWRGTPSGYAQGPQLCPQKMVIGGGSSNPIQYINDIIANPI